MCTIASPLAPFLRPTDLNIVLIACVAVYVKLSWFFTGSISLSLLHSTLFCLPVIRFLTCHHHYKSEPNRFRALLG